MEKERNTQKWGLVGWRRLGISYHHLHMLYYMDQQHHCISNHMRLEKLRPSEGPG